MQVSAISNMGDVWAFGVSECEWTRGTINNNVIL